MPEEDIDLKIKTHYQGQEAKEAIDDQKKLAAAAAETGKDFQKMGTTGADAMGSLGAGAKVFKTLQMAARGGTLSVRGLVMSVRVLWATLVANPLGAAAAGVMFLVTWLLKWMKASREAKEQVKKDYAEILEADAKLKAKTAEDADKARFEGLAAGLKEIADLYEKANAAAQRQLDFQRKMGDAELAEKLADLDAEEEKELEGASSDPAEQARIRAKYAGQRVAAKQANSRATADRELAAAQARADASVENLNRTQAAADSNRGETAAEKAHRENEAALQKSAQTLGLKNEQEKQLGELAELREKRQAGRLYGADQDKLRNLEKKEDFLIQQQKDGSTYAAEDVEKLKSQAANIPALQKRADLFFGEMPDFRRSYGNPADIRRAEENWRKNKSRAESDFEQAQAANTFLGANAASGGLKAAADSGAKTREAKQKELDAAAAKAAEEMEAQNRELAVQQKQRDTLAKQQSNEAKKTEKSGNESVAVAEFEEGKKELEAARAALKLKEQTAEVIAQIADLDKQIIDLQKPGTTPSAADERARDIAKQGVDQEAQKRIAELQKKEADEAERRRKEFEKNGGAALQAKSLEVVSQADALLGQGGFNANKVVHAGAEEAKKDPLNIEKLQELLGAVEKASTSKSGESTQQAKINNSVISALRSVVSEAQARANMQAELARQGDEIDNLTRELGNVKSQGRNGGFGKR